MLIGHFAMAIAARRPSSGATPPPPTGVEAIGFVLGLSPLPAWWFAGHRRARNLPV